MVDRCINSKKNNALKVFVSDIYDEQAAQKLKSMQADALLCNQLKASAPIGLEILDANSERIAGTWEAWNSNEPVVASLLKKVPALRYHKGIDLLPALLKTVLWANRKYGYLQAWLRNHTDAKPLVQPDLYPISRGKLSIKYLNMWLQSRRSEASSTISPLPEGAVVAMMVEDMFEWNILLPVARELGAGRVCWVLPPKAKFSNEELAAIKTDWQIWKAPPAPALVLPWIPLYRLNKSELFCLNAWLNDLRQISDCLFWGEQLFASNIQVLVGLAQENTHVGHILCALAARHGKRTVNTMNGIKSAEAISAGTSFDAWLVWDEAMKHLLHEQVHVPEAQLVVAGSLQQDALANPEYSGTLPISESECAQRLIISVVSAKDLRIDKVEALDTLYQWASDHPDCVVLYRPHPLETEEYRYLPVHPKFRFELIQPRMAEHKQSLKDQLLLSDLVINFGSTVSIEAQWMGTPCITYEKKPLSDLYCVDGKTLLHLSGKEALKEVLNSLKKKTPRSNKSADTGSVAAAYARIIQSYVRV